MEEDTRDGGEMIDCLNRDWNFPLRPQRGRWPCLRELSLEDHRAWSGAGMHL